MNALARTLRQLPAAQWLLRGAVVVGLLVGAVAPAVDGHPPGVGYLAVAAILAVVAAIAPGSHAGAVAMTWVLVGWLAHERTGLGPAVLAVAVGLVIAQVAAALAAYVPARGVPDGDLVRLWLRRALVVLVPSVVVWLVVRLIGGGGEQLWAAGALVVVAAAVGVSLLMSGREAG